MRVTKLRKWLNQHPIVVSVLAALFIIAGAYQWNRIRMWTLKDRNGRSVCLVQPTWTEVEVLANCGPRSGRGVQPKLPTAGPGFLSIGMCSALGDVYGNKVVLYGCDGRVQAVEHMPAPDFIYASN